MSNAPVLCFDAVSKWFGPVIGVNQVSLELGPGITGLVGHNGAGKSTLMRLAAGLIRPELGDVRINGTDAWHWRAKHAIGYCPDHDAFYEDLSGRRFLHLMARLSGQSRGHAHRAVAEQLDFVGMTAHADRALRGYSKGMRQRIKLAQALLHDPPLLLLDEPLSGIDPTGRRESIALFLELQRRGKCLLVSSHELDELDKLTNCVIIMAAGRIAASGTTEQLRDVLDSHPLAVRIDSDRPRELAVRLLDCEWVVGVDRRADGVIVRARQPRRFFEWFGHLVVAEGFAIHRLQSLDESTSDVLAYLLGGKSRPGEEGPAC